MNLRVTYEPEARLEFVEASAWYENQHPGLGREFGVEFKRALQRAQTNPERFPKVRGKTRTIRLRRFSHYSIYFAVKGQIFSILAVFHGSRDPEKLKRRLR